MEYGIVPNAFFPLLQLSSHACLHHVACAAASCKPVFFAVLIWCTTSLSLAGHHMLGSICCLQLQLCMCAKWLAQPSEAQLSAAGFSHAWHTTQQRPMQEKHQKFHQRFPEAEELGTGGMCSATACTVPFLLATGLLPEEAQTQEETWGPCLQEVALDVAIESASAAAGTCCTSECLLAQCVRCMRLWMLTACTRRLRAAAHPSCFS